MVVEEKTVQDSKAIEVQKQRISKTYTFRTFKGNTERMKECRLITDENYHILKEIINDAGKKLIELI